MSEIFLKKTNQNEKPMLAIVSETSGRHLPGPRDVMQALNKYGFNYTQEIVKDPVEAGEAVNKHTLKHYQAIAVFGGDSTVAAVIKAIKGQKIPLIILRGGSANLLAREFEIPSSIKTTLEAYKNDNYVLRYAPVAKANRQPLVFDLHFGFFAIAINQTSKKIKRFIGHNAYKISAIRQSFHARKYHFKMTLDGKKINAHGYALFVLVGGGPWIMGRRVGPRPKAECLRVLLVKKRDFFSAFSWLAVRIFTGREIPTVTKSWHAKKVIIEKSPTNMNLDDQVVEAHLPLKIKMTSQTTQIVVPRRSRKSLREINRFVHTNFYRYTDWGARLVSGIPSERYSRISERLYLGGQYRDQAISKFESRNITGVVNMREHGSGKLELPETIDELNLSTKDRTAPSLKDLHLGVEFMKHHIKQGGAVYVHCNLGEGRGPSMAAAYLIATGMRPQDAIAHLQQYRPFAKPNKKQRVRLHEFAETIKK